MISNGNEYGLGIESYATMYYWSNLPYTHGLKENKEVQEIVKYKAVPCDGQGIRRHSDLDQLSDNYLQEEIVQRSLKSGICMEIQVQFMDLEALKKKTSFTQKRWKAVDWVENGGLLWDESEMPFYPVGRVICPTRIR